VPTSFVAVSVNVKVVESAKVVGVPLELAGTVCVNTPPLLSMEDGVTATGGIVTVPAAEA
jgi:hypothetical protein